MNKYFKIGFFSAIAAIALQSCYDEKMEWYNPYTPISKNEIPQLIETQIGNCAPLKSYAANLSSDFHLGVSVLGSSYVENSKYASTVNDNFNSIQPSTEFALCNVVTDINGTYNYDMPDALYNAAINNGLSFFGHSLISNQFQNVEYLQNAIADKVSPSEEKNYVNVNDEHEYDFSYSFNLEDYQKFNGKEHYNEGWSFSSSVDDAYFNVGVQSLEITDGDDCAKSTDKACLWASTEGWEQGDATDVAQVVSDYIPVPTGKLNFSFYVKGYSLTGQTAKMRVRILGVEKGLNGLVPSSGGTSAYTSEIRLTNEWKQISFRDLVTNGVVSDYTSPVPAVRIVFDITEAPNSYVYFDNLVLEVGGGSGETVVGTNYIANSYFDGNEKTYNWSFVENRESVARMELGKSLNGTDNSKSGGNCLKVVNTASYNSAGDVTINAMFADGKTLEMGQRYCLTFYARADDNNAIIEFSTSNRSADKNPASAQAPADGKQSYALSTVWEKQVWEFTALTSDIGSMNFKFAKTATTFYLDDVTLTKKNTTTSSDAKSTRVPNYVSSYDDAMKAANLAGIMKKHIRNMMERYDKVEGWDVVQHIVTDNPTSTSYYLDSKGLSVGNGEFYWGDYMKEDFIYNAFSYAKEFLKEKKKDAKLFVSEGNLVHNERKQNRLAEFINRLQAYNGQKLIDGLSLELHLVCSTEIHTQAELLNQVTELFKNLNSTYCTNSGSDDPFLIRIGELDVQIESDYLPSVAQLAAQAEMYEHVINCYRTIINQRNQYGVYMWMLSDSDVEQGGKSYNRHRSLFDEDFNKKHAYLGVCKGFDETAGTTASY